MSLAYSCDEQLPSHVRVACPNGADREFGKVRSCGLISEDYLPTLLANPIAAATWQAGIDAGKIDVIPDTAGTFQAGDPKELRGYGDRKSSTGPREMTLNFFDPNYKPNEAFYNAIGNATNKVPFYRTSSLVHIADKPATIVAKDDVEDDLESEVVWNVQAKWTSSNLPSKHDISGLDSIFKPTA